MSEVKKVAIIVTSTRTPRIGPTVGTLVRDIFAPAAEAANIELSIVDLATFNLPVYNEAAIPFWVPSKQQYVHPESLAWTAEIARHDAYILIVPEYNFGMSGGTKNAIDYLYNEWIGRPVAVVSYGIQGGKTASEQVSTTLKGMKLRVAETRPNLGFARATAGTDCWSAMGEGVLGEESRELWTQGENKEQLLKTFDEVRELLEATPEATAVES
jgi:NAD(P)H-dependent FMN reductase